MLFVGTSIIHPSTEGVFLLCNILDLLIYSSKLIFWQNGQIENPPMGYCVYNADKGYLVTTNMKNKKGSPNPILIEKKCGNLSMADILTQVLYLSQLHVGSTQKMRLPITTGYADKICKNREFVPEGKMDDRLFFL